MIRQVLLGSLLATLCSGAHADTPNITKDDAQRIVVACHQTISTYSHARDDLNMSVLEGLFVESSEFVIGDNVISGREAILDSVLARAAEPTFHLVSSVLIDPVSNESATGISYASLHIGVDGKIPNTPSIIVRYNDVFDLRSGSCLFKSRTLTLTVLEDATNE